MSSFYILQPDRTPAGPFTDEQMHAMQVSGQIGPATLACQAGASQWATVAQLLPPPPVAVPPPMPGGGALPPPMLPPPMMPPPLPMGGIGGVSAGASGGAHVAQLSQQLAHRGAEAAGMAHRFARRILASNFTKEAAGADEKLALERARTPVTFPIGQNYAAWRRAILWFSGVGLAISALAQIPDLLRNVTTQQNVPVIFRLIFLLLFGFQVAASGLALWGALVWAEVPSSRRLARLAYFCQFLGPLLLFCIPARWLMSGSLAELRTYGTLYAVIAVIFLMPKIFGIMPGLVRACLTLRTLVPESPMPGWICVLIAPLYCLLFSVLVIVAAQAGSGLLFLAFLVVFLAPLFVILDARNLCRPANEADMNRTLTALRWRMLLATIAGLLLLLWAGYDVLKSLNWHMSSLLNFFASLVGNVFLVTAVASDFLIGLMRTGFNQEEELRASPLYEVLHERFVQLGNVRMADLGAGEGEMFANVGDLMRRARAFGGGVAPVGGAAVAGVSSIGTPPPLPIPMTAPAAARSENPTTPA
ncbi:MAG: DUF4339 domain-containing protein [Verrucomicrobia bacterium]|nr:DUF4339 domain-containing protein [Verrucomicrobiota bacterium]